MSPALPADPSGLVEPPPMLDPDLLRVDRRSSVPAYEQVRGQLAVAIRVGSAPPGRPLPPIRQLAARLQLAPGTVARAYAELERDGLVEGRRRAGTVVVDDPPDSEAALDRTEQLAHAADSFARVAVRLGVSHDDAAAALAEAMSSGPPDPGRAAIDDRDGGAP